MSARHPARRRPGHRERGHVTEHPRLLHTVLDTTRPRELAEFYRRLLGLEYRPGDEPPADGGPDDADWLVLVDLDSGHGPKVSKPAELARVLAAAT
jgi:hypothetical protein